MGWPSVSTRNRKHKQIKEYKVSIIYDFLVHLDSYKESVEQSYKWCDLRNYRTKHIRICSRGLKCLK